MLLNIQIYFLKYSMWNSIVFNSISSSCSTVYVTLHCMFKFCVQMTHYSYTSRTYILSLSFPIISHHSSLVKHHHPNITLAPLQWGLSLNTSPHTHSHSYQLLTRTHSLTTRSHPTLTSVIQHAHITCLCVCRHGELFSQPF